IPPSFRLWRPSVTVEELTTTVSRYLGEERTRTSFDSYALTRGISIDPKAEADFQLLRYAEHLLASAIGAASSRLVLSLLLRKRTVSTKAALKLLDDANAAIYYNREILQTALDHVRQGIAVFDKELHLVCWNRQFGEILALPPQLTRVGTGLDHILRFHAEQSTSDKNTAEALVRERLARYVASSEPLLDPFADRHLRMEVSANTMADGGGVARPGGTRPFRQAEKRGGSWSPPANRGGGGCRRAPKMCPASILNSAVPRARPKRPTFPRPVSSPQRATTFCSRSMPLAFTSPAWSSGNVAATMPSLSPISTPRSTPWKKYSAHCSTFRGLIPAQ